MELLYYSRVSLVAQRVKNPPVIWKTWVPSLGWKDPLEAGMAAHSSILAWSIPMDRGAWRAAVRGVAESRTWLSPAHYIPPRPYLPFERALALGGRNVGRVPLHPTRHIFQTSNSAFTSFISVLNKTITYADKPWGFCTSSNQDSQTVLGSFNSICFTHNGRWGQIQ